MDARRRSRVRAVIRALVQTLGGRVGSTTASANGCLAQGEAVRSARGQHSRSDPPGTQTRRYRREPFHQHDGRTSVRAPSGHRGRHRRSDLRVPRRGAARSGQYPSAPRRLHEPGCSTPVLDRCRRAPQLRGPSSGITPTDRVTPVKDEVTGHGRAVGRCRGALTEYPVQVSIRHGAPFALGPAQAEITATVREGHKVVEIHEWRREVEIVSEP